MAERSRETVLDRLDELVAEKEREDLLALAQCEHARLESEYWEVWRWRRRIRPDGQSRLRDARAQVALENLDTLLRYVEVQRDVIHRMLTVCAEANRAKKKPMVVYQAMCSEAERYLDREVEPEDLRRGQTWGSRGVNVGRARE